MGPFHFGAPSFWWYFITDNLQVTVHPSTVVLCIILKLLRGNYYLDRIRLKGKLVLFNLNPIFSCFFVTLTNGDSYF